MSALAKQSEQSEAELGAPLLVKLSRIERFEGNPRRWFDPQSLEELADAIIEEGHQTPVKICRNSKRPGFFFLVDGERRWRAHAIIEKRTGSEPLLKCYIDAVRDEKHHFRLSFINNLHREDLIPLDAAAAYQRLYDDSKERTHSSKVADVANIAKKSISHIENYLAVHRLPDEVKAFMSPERPKHEQLTVTAAIDIAKSTKDQSLQITLAKEAVERNLGSQEVKVLIGIRTGNSGYNGVGGRMRRPSDDYRMLRAFLGRSNTTAKRMLNTFNFDIMYDSRDDEFGDRKRDAETIELVIHSLKKLLEKIETT